MCNAAHPSPAVSHGLDHSAGVLPASLRHTGPSDEWNKDGTPSPAAEPFHGTAAQSFNVANNDPLHTDDDKCGKLCDDILEELETIDDDTDKHGIQFVKSKDSKLASEIGIFSFPALVYYETGVPIMYDGKSLPT